MIFGITHRVRYSQADCISDMKPYTDWMVPKTIYFQFQHLWESHSWWTFVMWSSKMSQNSQILILRYRKTKKMIFWFPIVFVTLQLPISLELIDQFQWGLLEEVALQVMYTINQKRCKLNLTDFIPILLAWLHPILSDSKNITIFK